MKLFFRSKWTSFFIYSLFLLSVTTCKNDLITQIEDSVVIAVTPPEVISNFPANLAEDIPISLNTITVTFSKYISADSVNSNTFIVSAPDGSIVSGSRKVENDTITFTPNGLLTVGTRYTVTLTGIKDIDKNSISGEIQWSFTTGIIGDSVKPVISAVHLNEGALWTNSNTVIVSIEAVDNFGIALMNINTSNSFPESGWVPYSDTFTYELLPEDGLKNIYVKVKDGSGLISDTSAFSSISLDTVPPVRTYFAIDNGNSGTQNNSINIEVSGTDETGGSGIYGYRLHTEGSDWGPWADLTSGGAILENISLNIEINRTETFYLQLRDLAGNESEIYSESITYDFDPPDLDLDSCYPVPGSIDNRVESYLVVAFDEQMDVGTIDETTVYVTKGIDKISTAAYAVSLDRKSIIFSEFSLAGIPYKLEQNKAYNVFISRSVSDVAGNALGEDKTYSFSNDVFEDTTAPSGSITLLNEATETATQNFTFDLKINAVDDYNNVRQVLIWGDNDDSVNLASFESNASPIFYTLNYPVDPSTPEYMSFFESKGFNWTVPSTDGFYYIYYKFVDYADNWSPRPGILKISLDTTPPLFSGFQIGDGSGFLKSYDNTVNIIFDAIDTHSGLNQMWLTVRPSSEIAPTSGSGSWFPWTTLKTGVSLSDGEGEYTIYAEAMDSVGLVSGVTFENIILDNTNPQIRFTDSDFLFSNKLIQQPSIVTDLHPVEILYNLDDSNPMPAGYQIGSGIKTYTWEKIEGLGEISFFSDNLGTVEDNTVAAPYIKAGASDGSEDDVYILRLTVTDNAGNSHYDQVSFVWDTIPPEDLGIISVFHTDGSPLNTSDNSAIAYTSSERPFAVWEDINGADFYVIIPSGEEFDPNVPAPVQFGSVGWYPHWDDDEVDWSDPATYANKNYIVTSEPSITAPAPFSEGDNDGNVYLYISAWDKAGNRGNTASNEAVQFWIDTLPPVMVKHQPLPPSKDAFTIDFRLSFDEVLDGNDGYGFVYDQKSPSDPYDPDDAGSGILSYSWSQVEGPGTLAFSDATILSPTISASTDGSEDGQYQLSLTITDKAGNIGVGYVNFTWDTTRPLPVSVYGPDRTPDRTPTWAWTSGGGGNGTFEYQLVLEGNDPVPGSWVSTTDTFYAPSENLDNNLTYVLYVREYDDAGNYSDETDLSSSHPIWVDTSYVTSPSVSLVGAYLKNSESLDVTWTMGSGIGEPATEYYRFWIENSSGVAVLYGSGSSAHTIGPFSSGGATTTVDLSSLLDGVYTIKVQEYDSVNYIYPDATGWTATTAYIGNSTVSIDATAPSPPTWSYIPGSGPYSGTYLTNDSTPYFSWAPGSGDGIRQYRWSLDESSWNYTSTSYVTPTLYEGVYTFYVQERDQAGNWSTSLTHNLEIDTTAPTLSSVTLKSRIDNAYNREYYTIEPFVDIDFVGSGSNSATHISNDIAYMRFWNSGGSYAQFSYNATGKDDWAFSTNGGSTADGTKYVYCTLVDYAGNVSVSRYDTIYQDTVAPSVTSFTINNNATNTSSSSTTLNSVYSTGTYDAKYMRISNNNGATWSGWYTASSSRSWNLDTSIGYSGYGTKKVLVQFTDYAGYYCRDLTTQAPARSTDRSDSIFYGTPSISYVSKGLKNGAMQVYFNDFNDSYSSPNTYHVYYSTTLGGTTYSAPTTTDGSSASFTVPSEGTIYYFIVRVSNPDVGSNVYTSFSSATTSNQKAILGYSSDITIVYDSTDSVDSSLASGLRSFITYGYIANIDSYSPGSYLFRDFRTGLLEIRYYTDPGWSVTLLPENLISTAYDPPGTVIGGDPIIITPGADMAYTTTDYEAYRNQVHNIAKGGNGVLGMHAGGSRFLSWTSAYWYSDAYGWNDLEDDDIPPSNIDSFSNRGGPTLYVDSIPETDGRLMWHKYFYYDYKGIAYDSTYYSTARDNVAIFLGGNTSYYGEAQRYAIYYSGTTFPTAAGVSFYARDPDNASYYTVGREGRFAFWGYDKVPYFNRGKPLLHNLIRYLNSSY